jgi:hypothetical protein
MRQWLFVVAIGAMLDAGSAAQACPAQQASCDHPAHLAHHPRHRWHRHEHWEAARRPADPARYVPYEEFYPPMPASIFDLPPDRDFLNYLR